MGAPLFNQDAVDFRVEVNFDAQLLQETAERVDYGSGPSEGVVDAPLPFKVVDKDVDAGGGEGIAADQERLEGEAAAQEVVLEKL